MHAYIRNVDAKKLTHTTCGVVSNMIVQRTLEHLEWKLLGDFSKTETNGDSKEALNFIYHKSYALLQNYKGVEQYLGLPCPFQF